ncbi:MAG: sulfatase-like hydrolase/transferase, partial [Planctomycetota bacterium]|nr:sulfatase-like hydrolase/transferase [Planctomycetota bacterium]
HPNLIFILGEGHGWSSTSVDLDGKDPNHAQPAGLTPNLERMAKEGMRFSDFYASCPRCTPSRASFLTGLSPAKLHMTYVNEGGRERRGGEDTSQQRVVPPTPLKDLSPDIATTASLLRAQGYATAHFGKWHVGRVDPMQHGFDLSDGPNSNQGPDRDAAPNPTQCFEITERGIEFVREQAKAGKPFFLQLSHYAVGAESDVTPESLDEARALLPKVNSRQLAQAAGVRDVDKALGQLLAVLDSLELTKTTYVFFSTDHGTPGGNANPSRGNGANPPFAGGKGSVREGGIRIPFLALGPDVAAGTLSGVRASGMDLLPTLLDLAGAPLKTPEIPDDPLSVEGGSLAQVLRGVGAGKVVRPREELVIHFPHYDLDNGGPASAIYLDEWKLVRNYDTGAVTLHDIAKDREERNDVAKDQPETVKELLGRLDGYLAAVGAQMPTKIGEAPSQPTPPTERRERRGRGEKRRGGE